MILHTVIDERFDDRKIYFENAPKDGVWGGRESEFKIVTKLNSIKCLLSKSGKQIWLCICG